MKKKKSLKKINNPKITKPNKSDFLNIELYGAKDAWFAIRINSDLLHEIKAQSRKEKIPIQKFARRALMQSLLK